MAKKKTKQRWWASFKAFLTLFGFGASTPANTYVPDGGAGNQPATAMRFDPEDPTGELARARYERWGDGTLYERYVTVSDFINANTEYWAALSEQQRRERLRGYRAFEEQRRRGQQEADPPDHHETAWTKTENIRAHLQLAGFPVEESGNLTVDEVVNWADNQLNKGGRIF